MYVCVIYIHIPNTKLHNNYSCYSPIHSIYIHIVGKNYSKSNHGNRANDSIYIPPTSVHNIVGDELLLGELTIIIKYNQ